MNDRGDFKLDLRKDELGARYVERRSYIFPIVVIGVVLLAAGAGAAYYIYTTSEMFAPYKRLYAKLGVDLPRSFEYAGETAKYLDRLQREPCDGDALQRVARSMEAAGYLRESASTLEAFHRGCTPSPGMLQSAYNTFTGIGDHAAAIRVADELTQYDPGNYDYRFMRGKAYENSKNYKSALADYVSTLALFPDLSKVHVSQFYEISDMYDKIGKPCDAIGPLETYISYNVKERQSQQIAKLISEYSQRGKCAATYANGSARVVMPPSNVVDVTMNGARGRMIVDTGASSIVITPEMAARARITPDESNLLDVKVVGGSMKQATGYAQNVQVAEATAANVPVLIAVRSKDAFGSNIDGLLGMTFLSRFNVTVSSGILELKPRNRN
jgi:clan AA aspartic protease (TIGR02281 family)